MGSTYQFLIGVNAIRQLRYPIRHTDSPALAVFHLQKIRDAFRATDAHPERHFLAKVHAAFPEQVEAVLVAKHSRIFLVWRDQKDALISDFHFAQRRGGHVYANFNDYFKRRGRKILLRNCLQQVVWSNVDDDRVMSFDYMDLVDNFDQSAAKLLSFAGLHNVDLEALQKSVSISELRKRHNDPKGTFFRKGGKLDLEKLTPSRWTKNTIAEIVEEDDQARLAAAFEREDWARVMIFGRECREAGLRKTFHWWLYKKRYAQYLRENILPFVNKFSPRSFLQVLRAQYKSFMG